MTDYDQCRENARALFKIFDGQIETFFGSDNGKETLWKSHDEAESLHELDGVQPVVFDQPKRKRK